MKAIVIGAGLGGLLSAARLSKAGYQVEFMRDFLSQEEGLQT